uniref:Putative secreted protein n=1 Tax=Ixodes ricinus TaxID=34613 RepID=A0A6B0UEE6_IXORI
MRKHASRSSALSFHLPHTCCLGHSVLTHADGHAVPWGKRSLKLTRSGRWEPRRRAPANGTEAEIHQLYSAPLGSGKLGAVCLGFSRGFIAGSWLQLEK